MKKASVAPISEIFFSVQGEGYKTGLPAWFVRVSKCNLNCPFCDTTDKIDTGSEIAISEIVEYLKAKKAKNVVITGGEPTLYPELIKEISENFDFVMIETNGTLFVELEYLLNVYVCCSPKLVENQLRLNLPKIDELKVLWHIFKKNEDFFLQQAKYYKCKISIQPLWQNMEKEIPEIIEYLKNHQNIRLSLQTHKFGEFA